MTKGGPCCGAEAAQLPDVPYDSEDPLFPFGHGLSY